MTFDEIKRETDELFKKLAGDIQVRACTFRGSEFLFIGSIEKGAAIATREAYENFDESFAYLDPDGIIRQHHIEIGKLADLEIGEEVPR